jgi:hypothetical protein
MSKPAPNAQSANSSEYSAANLMIPVVGIKPEEICRTLTAFASGGRVHNALILWLPGGAPVVALPTRIVKFFDSESGRITIYH